MDSVSLSAAIADRTQSDSFVLNVFLDFSCSGSVRLIKLAVVSFLARIKHLVS